MASLTYNSSIFTNVKKWSQDGDSISYNGILIASKLNQKNGQDYRLLDAIDIDWNGAWVRTLNTYLHNTDDLIHALNAVNNNSGIQEINNELKEIWKQIDEISGSYVTTTELNELLKSDWQEKLVAGEFIKIDKNSYTISAYGLPTYEYLDATYATKYSVDNLRKLFGNYYDKDQTLEQIKLKVKAAIDEVINGADSAFDTLKEIADWILGQNRYIEVTPEEVINNFEKDKYCYWDEENSRYVYVTDPSTVITDGSVQYYKVENYFTDVKELIDDVADLQETVGSVTQLPNGEYSYTGILKEVELLKFADKEIKSSIKNIANTATTAETIAREASKTASEAKEQSQLAYDTANEALDIAKEGIGNSNLAYEMAYSAYVSVGKPTTGTGSYLPIDFLDVESYASNGEIIYFYSNTQNSYYIASEPYKNSLEYFIWDEIEYGNGLYRRVEVVEDRVDTFGNKIDILTDKTNKSLYNLHVNNSSSTYIKLSLSPSSFNGDPSRTLSITTLEGSIDKDSGIITNDGIPSMGTIFDITSYMLNWQML